MSDKFIHLYNRVHQSRSNKDACNNCAEILILKDPDFYDEFEIGFPSEEEHLLMPFCENEDQPTQTVYGFVPVKVVDRVLARHGGIDEDATLTRSKQDGMA